MQTQETDRACAWSHKTAQKTENKTSDKAVTELVLLWWRKVILNKHMVLKKGSAGDLREEMNGIIAYNTIYTGDFLSQ